jgi:beta-galactosidase
MTPFTSIWAHLPTPREFAQPKPFEALGQNQGLVLYRTKLVGHHSGTLSVHELHDFATVFVDGKFVGTLDRRAGVMSIKIPPSSSKIPVLDILVEGMGHINFAQEIVDRKGVTDRVVLNGMTLMDWQVFSMPLFDAWIWRLSRSATDSKPGTVFQGKFDLVEVADTYIDVSGYSKGYVWVNGHDLGRYWDIGPQKRLYCPASWLRKGANEVRVLDLLTTQPAPVAGFESPG